MTFNDIAVQRLHTQHLLKKVDDPVAVVRAFGAVQAQDFNGAKWALALRCTNATSDSLTALYNEGALLRTHVLRPTWHFVAPEDIRWMQELTGPRVHAFLKHYYKKMELDDAALKKGSAALVRALEGGNTLTPAECRDVLLQAGFEGTALRYSFIVMYAKLEALLCSGPMKGKQHTVALLSERAPQAVSLPRDEALAELTRRFFTMHGPATIQDFAWWSSLLITDIKKGIELAGLKSFAIDTATFYYTHNASSELHSPTIQLLPNYDELTVAYKERRPIYNPTLDTEPTYEALYFHIIMLDGLVVGGWKWRVEPKQVSVTINLFKKLSNSEDAALAKAIDGLQDFFGRPVVRE
ncbi:MAG TPA: winged helix DNA-binding domain-containing protein [Candidatus Saccharimonadales bacterium]|nr:winged helix DNA-binding domain-containing protein [Candidatus Saccharimonadales bacterium]